MDLETKIKIDNLSIRYSDDVESLRGITLDLYARQVNVQFGAMPLHVLEGVLAVSFEVLLDDDSHVFGKLVEVFRIGFVSLAVLLHNDRRGFVVFPFDGDGHLLLFAALAVAE